MTRPGAWPGARRARFEQRERYAEMIRKDGPAPCEPEPEIPGEAERFAAAQRVLDGETT